MAKNSLHLRKWLMTALFAALTVIATTSLRIPLPTGQFIHFGNTVVLLGILLLGAKYGWCAGAIGFAIFDILNGLAYFAPYFVLETGVVALAAGLVMHHYQGEITTAGRLLQVSVAACVAKLIMSQLQLIVAAMWVGNSFWTAYIASLSGLLATAINVATTLIVINLIYFPLEKAYRLVIPHN